MCNSGCSVTALYIKRQTTWDRLSLKFPYDITGYTAEIDFKDYATGTIIKRITSAGVFPNSRIDVDLSINTIYPVVSADDSELFLLDKLYVFDVALVNGADVKRTRSFELYATDTVTDAT